jgi:hypothetical protein
MQCVLATSPAEDYRKVGDRKSYTTLILAFHPWRNEPLHTSALLLPALPIPPTAEAP